MLAEALFEKLNDAMHSTPAAHCPDKGIGSDWPEGIAYNMRIIHLTELMRRGVLGIADSIIRHSLYYTPSFSTPPRHHQISPYKQEVKRGGSHINVDVYVSNERPGVQIETSGSFTDLEVYIENETNNQPGNKWTWSWGAHYSPCIDVNNPIDADTEWTVEDSIRIRMKSQLERSPAVIDLAQPDSIEKMVRAFMSNYYLVRNHAALVSIQATRILNMVEIAEQRGLPLWTRVNDVEHASPFVWYRKVDKWVWH